jgi:hypothetical protein
MLFTISKNLEQLPSYPMLCKLAEQNSVHVTGNEQAGLFSCRGVEGDYQFVEDGIHGKFAGHGITGEFSFEGWTHSGKNWLSDVRPEGHN